MLCLHASLWAVIMFISFSSQVQKPVSKPTSFSTAGTEGSLEANKTKLMCVAPTSSLPPGEPTEVLLDVEEGKSRRRGLAGRDPLTVGKDQSAGS